MEEWQAVRALTGEFYGLSADEIGICSCTSEAYNLADLALRLRPGDEVVINDLDFPSGRTPWLQPGSSASVRLWRSREGALRVEDLVPLLGPRTRLVTSSLVSYFNGFRIPLEETLSAIRRHSPAMLALDVTQALGRVPLHLQGVDLIVSSTHKWICAAHGGGLVGVPRAREAEWTVPAGGWFHLEDPFRSRGCEPVASKRGAVSFGVGMPNFPAIYAIRAGLEYIRGVGVEAIDRAVRPLVHHCHEGLRSLPVELLTPGEDASLAGIVAFRHERSEEIHRRLQEANIHVMHSSGRLRVSIHGYNTASDVEQFLEVLARILREV
jgi:selenocysteine lyase/cysteine desulfurase